MKTKYYLYLVSYTHNYGHGRVSIKRTEPIDSLEAVEAVEKAIMQQHEPSLGTIVTTNIILLKEWSE